MFVRRVLMILALTLFLLWNPLLNRYPFLHADSGTYVWSSVIFLVPQDRPIGYSLFIRAAQLVPSLWAVSAVQALGTAFLLWRVAERILALFGVQTLHREWLATAIGALTVVLTTLSTFVGFILADILASWILLGTALLLLSPRSFDRLLAGGAMVAGVATHNSHVLLAVGMALPLAVSLILVRNKHKPLVQRILIWFAAFALALASIPAVNFYLRAGPDVTRGGDTIWLNRFAESGVLQETLALSCNAQKWQLCTSAATIARHAGEPRWFLFGTDSPIHEVGWEKRVDEQRAIVLAAFHCCAGKIVESSARETWRQFWLLDIQAYLVPLADSMNAVLAVRENFPVEWDAFRASLQQTNQVVPTRLVPADETAAQSVFLVAATGLVFYSILRRDWRAVLVLGGAFYFLLLNAAVMATFSGAVTRYQGRVYWLMGYAVLIVLIGLVARQRRKRGEGV